MQVRHHVRTMPQRLTTSFRSRAVQINMNLSVLEEWIGKMGLPRGIGSHFAPVRDLLNWLQVSSPILCATYQGLTCCSVYLQ